MKGGGQPGGTGGGAASHASPHLLLSQPAAYQVKTKPAQSPQQPLPQPQPQQQPQQSQSYVYPQQAMPQLPPNFALPPGYTLVYMQTPSGLQPVALSPQGVYQPIVFAPPAAMAAAPVPASAAPLPASVAPIPVSAAPVPLASHPLPKEPQAQPPTKNTKKLPPTPSAMAPPQASVSAPAAAAAIVAETFPQFSVEDGADILDGDEDELEDADFIYFFGTPAAFRAMPDEPYLVSYDCYGTIAHYRETEAEAAVEAAAAAATAAAAAAVEAAEAARFMKAPMPVAVRRSALALAAPVPVPQQISFVQTAAIVSTAEASVDDFVTEPALQLDDAFEPIAITNSHASCRDMAFLRDALFAAWLVDLSHDPTRVRAVGGVLQMSPPVYTKKNTPAPAGVQRNIRILSKSGHRKDIPYWFVFHDEANDMVGLAMRGTDQVVEELMKHGAANCVVRTPQGLFRMHRGVYESLFLRFREVSDALLAAIRTASRGREVKRLQFVGHGLGGCYATAVMIILHSNGLLRAPSGADIACNAFTFGSPTVFASVRAQPMHRSEVASDAEMLSPASIHWAFFEARIHNLVYRKDLVPRLVGAGRTPKVGLTLGALARGAVARYFMSLSRSAFSTNLAMYRPIGELVYLEKPDERLVVIVATDMSDKRKVLHFSTNNRNAMRFLAHHSYERYDRFLRRFILTYDC
jgi:hypothetical protein